MQRISAWRGASSSRARTLAVLRSALARIEKGQGGAAQAPAWGRFALGAPAVDAFLGGGLDRACLHEVQAPGVADWPAAVGFGLALALRAAPGRPLLWARQDFLESEAGRLNGLGLAEFGADPTVVSLVRGRDAETVLRAGVDAARCKSLGAALIEIFGDPRACDLTATLRLARSAEASGVTLFLLRIRVGETQTGPPSAAVSRWRACAQHSRALLANAPGAPGFSVTLLRRRGGAADRSWRLEWRRDQGLFHEIVEGRNASLSGPVPALPADGAATSVSAGRRAG
ncbi:ImuA family protein [Rhodoblastus sp.]|uniref:ImuA family protein n=1 Tax=Rhodoblastus sp. TaxID=1962975 RepID=UPI0035B2A887